MTTPSGRINFDNQEMSSPLSTLVRKASAHRPNGGSTIQTPTQPQSPLIHTKFRGSVATASSYNTSRFQDEESDFVDVRTSDSTVRASRFHIMHIHSFPTATQPFKTPQRALELIQNKGPWPPFRWIGTLRTAHRVDSDYSHASTTRK